ncbi:EF-P 5-aminopentanol modification-associated protein YfmH [Siminovitchia sediminis]|uniref:EF-P 5-aminopentanol modification-associated protein YfmH n=1 Tax=Siminovitchia sediminis TaxID=1274353 RepID=A0ABW4KIC6_9BACI
MNTIYFDQLKETVYHETLPNGLQVYVLPKKGFNKTYATFTTKYGSVDNTFIPLHDTELHTVPDGIAHFLEHKMFEKKDGDVFQLFSKQGASANAFTSFTRTAYLFSSTSNVEQNLSTLIQMVQEPYFTEQTVEKEKGIIGQEITMYDDNPDWRLYFGLIENLFHRHPVKIDIAGTIESISHITADLLYLCYNTFYHPSNMIFFVTGPVDPDKIIEFVKEDQKSRKFDPAPQITRHFEEEPENAAKKKQVILMDVQTPKCMVGVKAPHFEGTGEDMLRKELTIQILLDILFGKSSTNYEKLYKEGLIDETFQFDYTQEEGFGFAVMGSDTSEPDLLAERLQNMVLNTEEQLSEEELERAKKKRIGNFLRAFNSPEFIANQFTRYKLNDMNLFDVVPVIENIAFTDIKSAAHQFFSEERMSVCQVVPKK